jgi:hypothetical protein
MQDWVDFAVICSLLMLNAVVSFAQEYHAGNIVDSLKETLALKATVTRNGQVLEIDAEEVVPGDAVHLEDVSSLSIVVRIMQQPIDLFCRAQSFQPMVLCSVKELTYKSTSRPSPVNLSQSTNITMTIASPHPPSSEELPL